MCCSYVGCMQCSNAVHPTQWEGLLLIQRWMPEGKGCILFKCDLQVKVLNTFLRIWYISYEVMNSFYRNGHQYKQQQHYTPQPHGLNYVQQGHGYLYPQSHGNFPALVQGRGPLQMNYVPVQNPGSYAGAASVGTNPHRFHQPHVQQLNFSTRNQIQTYHDSTDTSNELPKSPRQYQNGQGQHWKSKGPRIPRTEQESEEFFQELKKIFPDDDQEEKIRAVLKNHIFEHDFAKLTNDCMNVLF